MVAWTQLQEVALVGLAGIAFSVSLATVAQLLLLISMALLLEVITQCEYLSTAAKSKKS